MFSTSLAALAGVLAVSASIPATPAWQPDYRTARVVAAEQHKPVAVFIGQGGDAAASVVKEGTLGADAARALTRGYVCVYVDSATDAGRATAGTFGMATGVVLSDRTGSVQALRHAGPVTQVELATYLDRTAGETQPVADTAPVAAAPAMTMAAPALTYPQQTYAAPVGGCAGGNCGGGVPVSGGCPGGNCGGGSSRGGFLRR